MIDASGLPAALLTYLDQLETEIGVPIRVLNGGGRSRSMTTTRDWMSGNFGADYRPENNPRVREMLGITGARPRRSSIDWSPCVTVLNNGTFSPEYSARTLYDVTGDLYRDGRGRTSRAERILPHTEDTEALPVTFGDTVYAQIGDHVVSSLHDLRYFRDLDELNLDLLLGDPIRACISDDFAGTFTERVQAASQARFAALVRNSLDGQRRQAQAMFDQHEMEAAQLANRQAQVMRQLRESIALLRSYDSVEDISSDEVQRQWQAIIDHPRITSATCLGSVLTYETDEIIITHPNTGQQRTLGNFRIKLNFSSDSITMDNLTGKRGGRSHPHIPSSDRPCFGGMGATIGQAMADRNIPLLIEMLFQYLESFNPADSWGGYAAFWFGVPDRIHPEFNTAEENAALAAENPQAVAA